MIHFLKYLHFITIELTSKKKGFIFHIKSFLQLLVFGSLGLEKKTKAQSVGRNFCNRRFLISFASSDSPLTDDDSFAMNDDVAEAVDELSNVVVILLVLGCDVDVIVLIEFSK